MKNVSTITSSLSAFALFGSRGSWARSMACGVALSLALSGAVCAQASAPAPSTAASTSAQEREELAIAALRALMSAPPERALPLLQKTLRGAHSEAVKERALFVLAQIDSTEATNALVEFANSTTSESLRGHAIRALGISGNTASVSALTKLYPKASGESKTHVVQALMIAEAKAELLALVKANPNDPASEAAVMALSSLGAKAELRALAGSGIKLRNLVQAYAIADDLESLLALARQTKDPQTQHEAIRSIGIIDSAQASAALLTLYRELDDSSLKDSVLQGLMIQDDAQTLLKLYRSSSDAKEKARILKVLGQLDSDAALDAIDAALQGQTP